MKRLAITFLLCSALLYPYSSFAESTDSIAESPPVKRDVYGEIFSLSGQYSLNVGGTRDFLASISLMGKNENPYYNTPTSFSGKSPTIRIIPMELSIRRHKVFIGNSFGSTFQKLHAEARANYTKTQIFAGPLGAYLDNMSHATLTARPRPPSAMLPSGCTPVPPFFEPID